MHTRIALIPLVATAALVAGCGSSHPPTTATPTSTATDGISHTMTASQVLAAASSALNEAKSVHLTGDGMVDGKPFEVNAIFAGNSVKGSFTLGNISFDVIQVSNFAYIRAGDDYWKAQLSADVQVQVLPGLAGKYGKIPATHSMVPKLDDILQPRGDPTKDQVTTIDSKPVITIQTSNGAEHVLLLGKPYPADIVSSAGTLNFIDIDADVTIDAPPPSEVLDLSTFLR
jgi:hypothetical protein